MPPWLVIACLVAPSAVLAQEATDPDAEARALYDAGAAAFSAGRYEEAIERFEASYALSHRPELLYNIGSAADRLRRNERAIAAFEQYLAESPDAPNRTEVTARLAVLHAEVTNEGTSEPPPRGDAGPGPWILVGVGAAVAIAGAVLVGVAASDVAAIESAPPGSLWSTYRDAYDRTEALSIVGFVSLGLGAALLSGGVIWAALPSSPTEPSARVLLTPSGAAVEGRF